MDNLLRSRVFLPTLVVGLVALLGVLLVAGATGPRASAPHPVLVAATPSPSPSPSPSPTEPPLPPPPPPDPNPILASSTVADAVVSTVAVYASSTAGPAINKISGSNSEGQPEAFLVVDQLPGWYQVELPVKPNGSLGWIQASSVKTRTVTHYLRVSQSQFRLEHYVNGQLAQIFRVAVGAPSTPTPNGKFFVWASQAYGAAPYTPGIFALSGFSPVLENWPGGGRVGIHGWTDSVVMGTRASHGCVRVASSDFGLLLRSVPLGTPVDILP